MKLIGTIGGSASILDIAIAPIGEFSIASFPPGMSWCWFSGYGTVGERDGSLTFLVRRSGDTSKAATVDYALDQKSSVREGTNVIGTFGKIYFAPGVSDRNFSVFLIDDSIREGDQNLTIKLKDPTGGFFVSDEGDWSLGITDNDAIASQTNPVDQTRFFVREHYIDFLNREPDNAGLQFWQSQLNACGFDQQCLLRQRVNISAAFFLSIEFQQTGYLVYRFYKASFGRLPQFNEFMPDKQVIGQDVVVNTLGWEQQLEKNKAAFANFWLQRPDFKELYDSKTNAQYVDVLIANTGVAFSQLERDALINGLNNATETRATVLRKIAENQTFAQQEFNRAFVLMQYFGYLRRNPNEGPDTDYSGYEFWLNKLNAFNGDYNKAEMVKAFISSDEYRQRFGP